MPLLYSWIQDGFQKYRAWDRKKLQISRWENQANLYHLDGIALVSLSWKGMHLPLY